MVFLVAHIFLEPQKLEKQSPEITAVDKNFPVIDELTNAHQYTQFRPQSSSYGRGTYNLWGRRLATFVR